MVAVAAAYCLGWGRDRELSTGMFIKSESSVRSGSCIVHYVSPHLALDCLPLAFVNGVLMTRGIFDTEDASLGWSGRTPETFKEVARLWASVTDTRKVAHHV